MEDGWGQGELDCLNSRETAAAGARDCSRVKAYFCLTDPIPTHSTHLSAQFLGQNGSHFPI